MSQNETETGSHKGARAYRYRGRPGADPIMPCVNKSKLYTILHGQIKQQRCTSTLADTIQVRTM